MTEHQFDPKNKLEEQLLKAQQGLIGPDEFVRTLMESQVFMPVLDKHQIAGFQNSTQASPLIVKTEEDIEVLVLFTSPERSKTFVGNYPGYEGGLVADFKWVLEKTGASLPITLNPGWPVGMEMEPEMLQSLMMS